MTDRGSQQDADLASINVTITPMGYDGLSEMRVAMRFPKARRDLRWVLVASGQYEVPLDAPDSGYCRFRPERRSATEVLCPVDVEGAGPVAIQQRRLGVRGQDGIYGLDDYDGYDPETSTMIRGGIPAYRRIDPSYGTVEVAFPIRTPETVEGGSNTYRVMAAVGARNLGDFGYWPRIISEPSKDWGDLLDASALTPLSPATLDEVRLTVTSDLGFKELVTASPLTVSAERLEWTSPQIREQPIRYVLHDSVKEGSVLRRTFVGGVIGGLAATFLVWGLELALIRRR